MRGQDASPGIPARWMTASAPWQAAVMASRSVTDAWMASSAGPAVSGAMSSTRSVRPGPGQPRPQHGPDEARGPGNDDDRHPSAPFDSLDPGPVTDGYQVTYALFLSVSPDRRLLS